MHRDRDDYDSGDLDEDVDFDLDEDDQENDPADEDLGLDLDRIIDEVDQDMDLDDDTSRRDPLPSLDNGPSSAATLWERLQEENQLLENLTRDITPLDPAVRQRIFDELEDKSRKKEEARIKFKAAYKEYREAAGRGGMREGDLLDSTFVPYPVQFWTMKELKNRLAWLKRERGGLLGKPEKKQHLDRNTVKIRRYTRELFRRYSKEGMEQTRIEFNRLRRSRRRIANQRKIAGMMRAWKEKKKAERANSKSLKYKGEAKPPLCT